MVNFDRHGLLRRQTALESGALPREIDDAVHDGVLVAVGRGTYIAGASLLGKPAYLQRQIIYRSKCIAAATKRPRRSGAARTGLRVLSHESAAAVHGLALLTPNQKLVHLTSGAATGGAVKGRTTVFHTGSLTEDDIVVVDGVRVTSLARTVTDVAATSSSFAQSLAVVDSGLKRGVTRDELQRLLERPRKGVSRARAAVRHGDALAANPGESWCRAQIVEAGLPVPTLQKRYDLHDDTVAYVDHDFDGKVVLEFDGRVKYGGEYLGPGQAPSDVVIAEKLREDKLRELGLDVVRAIWDDLRNRQMIPLLEKHLRAHGITRLSGR